MFNLTPGFQYEPYLPQLEMNTKTYEYQKADP